MRFINQLFGLIGDLYSAGTVIARLLIVVVLATFVAPNILAVAFANAGHNNWLPWLLLLPPLGGLILLWMEPVVLGGLGFGTERGKDVLKATGVIWFVNVLVFVLIRFLPTAGKGGLVLLLGLIVVGLILVIMALPEPPKAAATAQDRTAQATARSASGLVWLIRLGLVAIVLVTLAIWKGGTCTNPEGDNRNGRLSGSSAPTTPFEGPEDVWKYCEVLPNGRTGACDIVDVDNKEATAYQMFHENDGEAHAYQFNSTKRGWGSFHNTKPRLTSGARIWVVPTDRGWDITEFPGIGPSLRRRLVRG